MCLCVHVWVSTQAGRWEYSFQKSLHSFCCGSQGLKSGCQASAARATSPALLVLSVPGNPWFCVQKSLDTVSLPVYDVFQENVDFEVSGWCHRCKHWGSFVYLLYFSGRVTVNHCEFCLRNKIVPQSDENKWGPDVILRFFDSEKHPGLQRFI